MIPQLILSRRVVISATAASTALLAMRFSAAQTASSGGDWLAMIKAHHLLISKAFEDLLKTNDKTFARRDRQQRTVAYLLTAHSVAEENVIYPALAINGLVTESDKLYLDQAHAKVRNAELEMSQAKDSPAWYDKVQALASAVLTHATQDEEGRIYPRLKQMLDASRNAALTAAYQREFQSVMPDKRTA